MLPFSCELEAQEPRQSRSRSNVSSVPCEPEAMLFILKETGKLQGPEHSGLKLCHQSQKFGKDIVI